MGHRRYCSLGCFTPLTFALFRFRNSLVNQASGRVREDLRPSCRVSRYVTHSVACLPTRKRKIERLRAEWFFPLSFSQKCVILCPVLDGVPPPQGLDVGRRFKDMVVIMFSFDVNVGFPLFFPSADCRPA